ncbi:MAG TPA: pyridoxamine 5'-phosphate oxidase family protein [Solirubrobacterales bacterium]|nr:pyridoxamine 5'-phosphate oxidase family protein [Solirubrobacterales bacterium]
MAAKPRNRVIRAPSRAAYDRETIEAILDEAIVSHVGTVGEAGHPIVIPTLHARDGDWLYIHGSAASKTLRRAQRAEICLTATLIDGLVLARSALHHSVNYRSVVVFGQAELVDSADDKATALSAITEKLIPGRWDDVRAPNELELRATSVLRLPLAEASAKLRTGGPVDDEPDYDLPIWAGTVGLRLVAGEPRPDDRLLPGVERPAYVGALVNSMP